MIRRVLSLILVIFVMAIASGCGTPLAKGTLYGLVLKESNGQPVPGAAVIIGREHASPLAPPETGVADVNGLFLVTVAGGNYTVQISSKQAGPFYTWPQAVYVEPNQTTRQTFVLPDGY
jgi:hypothetical protein